MKNKQRGKVLNRRKIWQTVIFLPLFFISLFFILQPHNTFAALNNSRIIDDTKFARSGTMDEAQIQQFLVVHGSYLANYTIPAGRYEWWKGTNYYESTFVGNVGQEVNVVNWKASTLIYNVSQWFGINPQVLLAMLEKESSAVTNGAPPYYLVMWATGYGYSETKILDYCVNNGNPSGSCAGFAMQISETARRLKQWMNLANSGSAGTYGYCTGCQITIDGQAILIGNGATAALYRYTPHIQTNFYYYFTLWFGSTLGDGPYVIASTSSPNALYLVDGGKKWHIPYDQWINWQLNKYTRQVVSNETFGQYTDGGELTNLVNDGTGTLYLIDNGQRRWIPNVGTFNIWGFSSSDVRTISYYGPLIYLAGGEDLAYLARTYDSPNIYFIDGNVKHKLDSNNTLDYWIHLPDGHISWLSNALLDNYSLGSDITSFFVKGSGPDVYAMVRGLKLHVASDTVLKDWGSPTVVTVNDLTLNSISNGTGLTNIVKIDGNNSIYFLEKGKKRKIIDSGTFSNWGFKNLDIIYLTPSTLSSFTAGDNLTRLARDPVTAKVYWVGTAKKRWVETQDALDRYGYASYQALDTEQSTRDLLADGVSIPDPSTPSLVNIGTKTYYVSNGTRYWIKDSGAFNGWGFGWNNIIFPYNYTILNALPEGDTMTRLPKDTSNNRIYWMESGTKKWVTTQDTMNLYGYPWGDVRNLSSSILDIASSGSDITQPSLIKDAPNVYYIVNGQKRWIPDAGTFSNWGFSWGDVVTPYSVSGIRNYPSGQKITRLVRYGTRVFYVENNQWRLIEGMSAFNIYNFNVADIVDINTSIYNSKTSGTTITFPQLGTYSYGGKVYFFENGKKRLIKDGDTFTNWGFDWNNIFKTQNNTYLSSYPEGQPLTRLIRDPSNNKVYLVESGTKRWVAGMTVFNTHGYKWSDVYDVMSSTLDLLLPGADLSS